MLILATWAHLAGGGLGKSRGTELATQGRKGRTEIYVDDADNPF